MAEVQELVKQMEELGIDYVFADGGPSEALLRDAIEAETDFRREYGDMVKRDFDAYQFKHKVAAGE